MAIKPSNKPRKTQSAKQGAAQQGPAQQKSTVTPIGQGANLAETGNRGLQSGDHKPIGDQRIEEEIRIRAYELFEQRGRLEGFHTEDWARAEAEVLAKYRRDKSA
jgi:hypothetical protein